MQRSTCRDAPNNPDCVETKWTAWNESTVLSSARMDVSVEDGSPVDHIPNLDHTSGHEGCKLASCMLGTLSECQLQCDKFATCGGFTRHIIDANDATAASRCWLKGTGMGEKMVKDARFESWTRPASSARPDQTHIEPVPNAAAASRGNKVGKPSPLVPQANSQSDVIGLAGPEHVGTAVRQNQNDHGAGATGLTTYMQLSPDGAHDPDYALF